MSRSGPFFLHLPIWCEWNVQQASVLFLPPSSYWSYTRLISVVLPCTCPGQTQKLKITVSGNCHKLSLAVEWNPHGIYSSNFNLNVCWTLPKWKYTNPAISILDLCKQKFTAPPYETNYPLFKCWIFVPRLNEAEALTLKKPASLSQIGFGPCLVVKTFLSSPVHTAWWAHMHRFLSVCLWLDKNYWTIIHISESIVPRVVKFGQYI